MTSYAHTQFTACNAKQFRAGLLNAINHDLKIDAESGEPNLSKDGIVRHGVWVNGRHIGYEATIDETGNFRITAIQCIRWRKPIYKLPSIDKLRTGAEDMRICRMFLGLTR